MALIDRYRRLREEMDAESISKRLTAIEDRLWYGPPGSAECSILAEELHEARQRGAEERARDSLAPPDLLILCVGYSPEPLLLAVAYHAPAHVALLVEMHLEQGYLRSLERLWDSFHDVLGVSSFAQLDRRTTQDSAAGVFLLVREIAERWRARSQGRVVLDISGAKKSMIAGAFLAGGLLDLDASYVDFDDYDALLRRPLPGTSRPGRLEHPYRLFKLREEARRDEDVEGKAYESRDEAEEKRKLKARVRPLRRGTRFLFHVDFENLTREELGYLLYALRPTPEFRHKLGMAKPLGLGRVRIDPLALCFIDRKACYEPESFFGPKYHGVESRLGGEQWRPLSPRLAHRYRHEVEALAAAGPAAEAFPRWNDLVDAVHAKIPEMVWRALELLGNPNEVHVQVTYPVLQGQDTEGEHFQWFVENDKVQKKALEAIPRQGDLPTLERYQQRPRQRRER